MCDGVLNADADLLAMLSFLDDNDAYTFTDATSCESTASSLSPPPSDFGDEWPEGVRSPTVAIKTKPFLPQTLKSTANGAPGARVKPVRSDKRQREEMIALREESLELQDRLAELKNRLADEYRPAKKQAKETSTTQREEQRKLRAMAWQAVNETQMKRRDAAEEERERLRELVDQQKKSFRQLRRYLQRHIVKHGEAGALASISLFEEDEEDTANDSSSSEAEIADFDELSRALPGMLLQTGGLFKDERLDTLMSNLRDLTVQNEETSRMTIEALDSRVVPFDRTTTADAIWQHHLTKAYHFESRDDETLQVEADSIRRKFKAATHLEVSNAVACGRMETRRYVESNRVVIVQSSIIDRIEIDGQEVPNFAIRQFKWTVVGPPRNDMLRESSKPISQVEIFGVDIPTMPDIAMDKESIRAAVKQGCIQAVSLQLEFERQSVENILMQQMLQGATVTSSMLHTPEW